MRRFLRLTGWAFIGTAAFVLSFLVYQVVGPNSVADSAQADLRQSLGQQWGAQAAGSPAAPNPTASAPAQQVARGQAFAIIRIPRIGVERVVVQGVGRKELRKGHGHLPSTVLPGRPGTFALFGHRTTYGAPFYRLDELRRGDRILIVTGRRCSPTRSAKPRSCCPATCGCSTTFQNRTASPSPPSR